MNPARRKAAKSNEQRNSLSDVCRTSYAKFIRVYRVKQLFWNNQTLNKACKGWQNSRLLMETLLTHFPKDLMVSELINFLTFDVIIGEIKS